MTVPSLTVSAQPAIDSDVDVLIVGASSSGDTAVLFADPAFGGLSAQLSSLGVTGGRDQLVRLPASVGAARSIAIIGIGKEPTVDALRYAAGSAVRQLTGVSTVAFAFPTTTTEEAEAVLEGAALGAYSFTTYRHSSLAATKLPAGEIVVHTGLDLGDAATRVGIIADAVSLIKDLVNTPPSDLYPESLARLAVEAVDAQSGLPIEVKVWNEDELVADGFGGIAGVGQGSTRPPRLVKVTYSPAGATRHLALVGKGITFDSGGLSIKPGAAMQTMKLDMAGAAAIVAATVAIAQLGLPIQVTAFACLAENMPSGSATRPGDVLTMRDGQTVEVHNTDAEGRLVLADGLALATEATPDLIVDVATLTGACMVALGLRTSGILANDDELSDQIFAASLTAGESMWPLPITEEMKSVVRSSSIADLRQHNPKPYGGTLFAAAFLREFVGEVPWAHLDIAGPSFNEGSAYDYTPVGGTGVGVRTLVQLATELSEA